MVATPVWVMVVMVLLGGGGNELLDYVPSRDYWQAKGVVMTGGNLLAELQAAAAAESVPQLIEQLGSDRYSRREQAHRRLLAMGPKVVPQLQKAARSDDPEVSARIESLLKDIGAKGKAPAVRRLMAIRGLGELKHRRGLPVLRKLVDSAELFEAGYARAAIAAIEGKPFNRPDVSREAMYSDVRLLPGNCGTVGQVSMQRKIEPITRDDIVKTLAETFTQEDSAAMLAQVNQALIALAERIGNVRFDGVTFALSDDIGETSGYMVILVRGLYDAEAVRMALTALGVRTEKVGQTELLLPVSSFALILPSNRQLVVLGGPDRQSLPVEKIIAALKTGRGKLPDNKAMMKLIDSAGTGAELWAVARISEAYRKSSLLAPFETVTFRGKPKPGRTDLVLKATGTDPEKVAQTVGEFNVLIAEVRDEITREAERTSALKGLAGLVGTIRSESNGVGATVTASFKGDLKGLLGLPMLLFWSANASFVEAAPPREAPDPPGVAPKEDF